MEDCSTGHHSLQKQHFQGISFNYCEICSNRVVRLPVLRKAFGNDTVQLAWNHSQKQPNQNGAPCSTCKRLTSQEQLNELDICICHTCQSVEIPGIFEQELPEELVRRKKEDPLAKLNKNEKEEYYSAMGTIASMKHNHNDGKYPDSIWKLIPALVGLPVLIRTFPLKRFPTMTVSLIVGMICVFLFTGQQTYIDFGLVPKRAFDMSGFRMLTYGFLHAGFIHLIGNLFYLWTFGQHVEDLIGKSRYLILLALGTFIPGICYVLQDTSSRVVLIGFSASVSAVLAFFVMSYPKRRITLAAWIFRFIWFPMPAFVAFVFWSFLQLIGAIRSGYSYTNVSFASHIVGAVVGICLWYFWKPSLKKT